MEKLKVNGFGKNLAVIALAWAILILPLSSFGQTRIVAPKNKYKVQDDIKVGQQAASQVQQQMPILNNAEATRYLEQVGQRLVAAIPPEYQHPEFQYSFKIVNASDINAFALPGGPMFVNRGMIEAAKNEGEMAGVMAHELSHVALRHGTAQATKQSSFGTQAKVLAMILGGAAVGGEGGAQLGALGAQAYLTKFSREYETQADILGSQIMARAGYDPRDLANMFKTIEQQGGGGSPQFLSDHPNPGNRYDYIIKEASMLNVSPEPLKITPGFQRTQSYLRSLPRARSTAEIEKTAQNNQSQSPTSGGTYSQSVPYPSTTLTTFNNSGLYVNYPNNWQSLPSNGDVYFAPQGAYGDNGISHGMIVGVKQGSGGTLQQETDAYVKSMAQQNNYQATGNYYRTTLNGRNGLAISMRGRSSITNANEIATFYTSQTSGGNLLYVITVAPESQSSSYSSAFSRVVRSIRYSGQ